MKTSVLIIILFSLQACSSAPTLSPISLAPEGVREAVAVINQEGEKTFLDFQLSSLTPSKEWIYLDAIVEQNRLFVSAYIGPRDDDLFQNIERVQVDTGFDGFLAVPLKHRLVREIWFSEEVGQSSSKTLAGAIKTWTGAASGFAVGEVLVWPMPVLASEMQGPSWKHPFLLGQEWFEIARAVWIDVENQVMAVSFSSTAVDRLLGNVGEHWIEVPWVKRNGSGLRHFSFNLHGTPFDAILDTGSSLECLIVKGAPPAELVRPITRGKARTGGGRVNILGAQTPAHALIESLEIEDLQVWWIEDIDPSREDYRESDHYAIIGLPFLRRGPIILDMERDRILIRQDR